MTNKLYKHDVYLKTCESTILEIIDKNSGTDNSSCLILVLDKTIFFPTGGGQPCDLGTINGISVIDVFEENDIVYHVLEDDDMHMGSCSPSPAQMFQKGQTVKLSLDWDRRFNNMQKHCGEHILSGIFYSELNGVNRGFHMGDSYMTLDIDIKDITWEQAMKIETLANKVIWSNTPVITRYFEKRKDAENLPLRKPLSLEENISIVCVGDINNPADCVACCGTHPSTAGQVGIIKILKLEKYKGMTRVYIKAGQGALLDYQNKNDIITALNNKYSSSDDDLIDKIKIQDEKNKVIRQELHEIKTLLITNYVSDIKNDYANENYYKSSNAIILTKKYDNLKINDLLNIGKQAAPYIKGLLLLICTKENTLILFSDGSHDCNKLVKENAPIYNGKGGGNKNNARAIFNKYEYIDTFIDLLCKHLR
ncbi:alanyl-tRNA editing protein [Anaerovorax odorimutans]|uniref:alanyl-tRNA editing protein n=1 Tax=Anaerovorax odorimutans TaxID=109327 RepID=UPI000404C307|nr:alanyl-tRNA editing protein [Anaerovorax odorimutans]